FWAVCSSARSTSPASGRLDHCARAASGFNPDSPSVRVTQNAARSKRRVQTTSSPWRGITTQVSEKRLNSPGSAYVKGLSNVLIVRQGHSGDRGVVKHEPHIGRLHIDSFGDNFVDGVLRDEEIDGWLHVLSHPEPMDAINALEILTCIK